MVTLAIILNSKPTGKLSYLKDNSFQIAKAK